MDDRVLIKSLNPNSCGFRIIIKVLCQQVILEKRCNDENSLRVAEYLVGDESGLMVLRVSHPIHDEKIVPGNTILIEQADVNLVDGRLHLELTRWAKITPLSDQISQTLVVDESIDWSDVQYGFFS